ncbi:MAG: 3-hydroxybutyryl-CoA dehydrogenase [Solirubrobacteraceae bacterium]|nr:3-hydroxybutyryl-CoA dehydrogenase [Solirubrobacteraceae bacterium]
MGAGIAQLGAQAGWETFLHDPIADVDAAIAKVVARWEKKGSAFEPPLRAPELSDLAGCDVIVEAVPERLELKQELFAQLGEVAPDAVLASNTSSIPITAIASAAPDPSRVVGMHFFNPPPLMRLVEVIPAMQTAPEAVARVRELGEAMGKRVIECADVAGFVVNRTNRPFGLEALRALGEQVADVPTIDRIFRLGGGFRMGPFELQDLVGIDVGYEVSLSFHELGFGEPRWRPSPLSARMVAAGWLGRKSGRGWYAYEPDTKHRPEDPEPPAITAGAVVEGEGRVADALRERANGKNGPRIVVDGLGGTIDGEPFYAIVPLALVEVTGNRGEVAFSALGLHTARVQPSVGGVLPRAIAQLVNEAHFSLGEGVASAQDIDDGLELGLNHPRGPLAWGELLGREDVLRTLAALREAHGDGYRAAPALRG